MFDQEKYRLAVIEPAVRNKNTPPADLFVRYAFDPASAPSPAAFDAQVIAVAKYWAVLQTKGRAYRPLTEVLLAAHKTLQQSGRLTVAYFVQERDRGAKEAGSRLKQAVEDLVAGGPVVAAATVAAVAAGLGGGTAEADLREQLRRGRVRVIDELWPLPASAPPGSAGLRNSRKVLGIDLSVAAVAGEQKVRAGFKLRQGLRVGGEPLTQQMFDTVKDRAAKQAQDERKTALDSVLVVLQPLFAAGKLEELVLWELMEAVRPAAELPMTSVPRVAREATNLGLDRDEAAEFALSVLMRRPGQGEARPGPVAEVEELLAAGSLRAAERLLATVAADDAGDLPDRVRAVSRRVADLAAGAQREIAAGRSELAAEMLTAAVREAADDTDLAGRLRALAPPPVTGVRAGVGAERVTIGWVPSAARTGGVTYQVVRTRGRAAGSATDGDVVGSTEGNEVVDDAPPAGDDLRYSVFANRAGGAWSDGAAAPAVAFLPEVTRVTVDADETSVRAGWTARPDAARVTVVREPDGAVIPAATRSGFTDTGLRPGTEYRYLVRVGYPAAGGAVVTSAGVAFSATPQLPPRAVPDLSAEPAPEQGADRLRLVWTPPESGTVVLRRAAHRPRWQPGTELTEAEIAGYGEPLDGRAGTAPNRRRVLTVEWPAGRIFITAFSVGGGRAVCGPTVAVTNTAPVTNLAARRVGPAVRLSWDWPPGVSLVRIRWWPADADEGARPAQEVDCWLRAYRDDGGAELPTGLGAVRIAVASVAGGPGEESTGVPATVRVAGAGVPVRYQFVERGAPFRRTTQVVLSCEQSCPLPELVVVQTPGRIAPLRPDQGTPVGRVPAQRLEPGRPVAVRVEPQPTRGPYRLGCFVDKREPGAGGVVLMGTPGGH